MPRRKRPYEELPLLPYVIADAVASEVYTGQEISLKSRSQSQVDETKALRNRMTQDQIEDFSRVCDAKCRAAYEARATWFMKCLRGNRGRDQLCVWIRHWLAAYLNDPEHFKRT